MYIIFHDAPENGMRYWWIGAANGYFTAIYENAKRYPTWESADKACKRIKRWSMQFMSEEDYQNWLEDGRVK